MAITTGTHSCCIALPIRDTSGDLRQLAGVSGQRISQFSQGGQFQPVKKGFHLSLAEFTAPSLAVAHTINGRILRTVSKKFSTFDITTHNHRTELFQGPKKDFVVLPVKVLHKKANKQPRVLMTLSAKINRIITKHGGTLLFPGYKPHITVGKITPRAVSTGVRLPTVGKLRLRANPQQVFAFKPFSLAPRAPAAAPSAKIPRRS